MAGYGDMVNKVVSGSGLLALIGSLTVSGMQYQENNALANALSATQTSLSEQARVYHDLVNICINRIDHGAPTR